MPLNPDSPGKGLVAIYIAAGILLFLLLGTTRLTQASPEYIQSEQTAAGSVGESPESSEHAFKLPRPMHVFTKLVGPEPHNLPAQSLELNIAPYVINFTGPIRIAMAVTVDLDIDF